MQLMCVQLICSVDVLLERSETQRKTNYLFVSAVIHLGSTTFTYSVPFWEQ